MMMETSKTHLAEGPSTMADTLHTIKITGRQGYDYADRFEARPGEPLTPEHDDARRRHIAVERFSTFTRLTLNDAALDDFIEDCAYYVEVVGGDGDPGWASSGRAALRQLVKQGYGERVAEGVKGWRVDY